MVLFACAKARPDAAAALVAALRGRSSRYQLDDAEPALFLVEDEYEELGARRDTPFERLALADGVRPQDMSPASPTWPTRTGCC